MKKPRALSIIFTSIACAIAMGGTASAQNVPNGCYARTYDDAHLAANPAQGVQWLTVNFYPIDGISNTAADLRVGMASQGHAVADGVAGMVLTQSASNLYEPQSFHVDGDGGSFDITRFDGAGLTLRTSGVFLSRHGDFVEEPNSTLAERTGSPTSYRLFAAHPSVCD